MIIDAILQRIRSARPQRLCDDEEIWPKMQSALRAEARRAALEEAEAAPAYGEDPQTEEELEHYWYMMDLAARDD